jgi:hypothetical protein
LVPEGKALDQAPGRLHGHLLAEIRNCLWQADGMSDRLPLTVLTFENKGEATPMKLRLFALAGAALIATLPVTTA